MTEYKQQPPDLLPCRGAETRNWFAWNDLMPPAPDFLHVVGEVQVGNPGVEPSLIPSVPQGINPAILLLDLVLEQQPGIWPQVVVWKTVRFRRPVADPRTTGVTILCGGEILQQIDVEDVH